MPILPKQLPVPLQGQQVAVRIHSSLIQLVQRNQLISNLVARIAQHQYNFLGPLCDSSQTDRKAVSGQNRKNNADRFSAQLISHICGNMLHRRIISLCSGHYGLRDGDNISVPQSKSFALRRTQDAVCDNLYQVVPLSDNRTANSSGYRPYSSFHHLSSPLLIPLTSRENTVCTLL